LWIPDSLQTYPIVLIGGGGHAKVVFSILRKLSNYRVLGYTDFKDNGAIPGAAYLGRDEAVALLKARRKKLGAVVGVGQMGAGERREELWTRMKALCLEFPVIVSPDAVMNKGATAEKAAVVMDGAVINCGAAIGRGAIINTNSTIEHDVVIGDWVHVAPGATISGGTRIGRYSMVGAGATVIEGINITEGCIIGAGAVVVRDLTIAGTYVGCPARRIK
jgi:sugar O-acyltransferase (sialic acid O-acetyltransferase NeuD family)